MKPRLLILATLCTTFATPTLAQQKVQPPIARFWMDAATHHMSMPGMEEMEDNPMLGLMGAAFGQARHGAMPGKWLDTALHTQRKPAGTEAAHAIPAGMNLRSPLPLLPVEKEQHKADSEWDGGEIEKPQGRLIFYWGCSAKVRAGQPRILDFAKASPQEFGKFMIGRHAPDRGAKAVPGRAVWPNRVNNPRLPGNASLLGEHTVSGEGVPANLRFNVPAGFDFMDKLRIQASGKATESVLVRWQDIPTATGYFLTAMGTRQGRDGVPEMIFWSASESPDPGWGLMDYLAPARVEKLIKEKVVLPRQTTQCALPVGIFAQTEGAMLRMVAYGPELNLAHPPRPTDPKIEWKPDWTVLLRLKSTGMAILGEAMDELPPPPPTAPARANEPVATPGAGELIRQIDPVQLFRGLLGR